MCRQLSRMEPCWRPALSAAMILLALVVLTAADFDKRSEMSPMPFVMGSRYGRSAAPRSLRGDRFLMGSRYGKRSEGIEPRASKLFEGVVGQADDPGDTRSLLCEFTGVVPLYRCVRHNKRDHYDVRIADESGMEEQV